MRQKLNDGLDATSLVHAANHQRCVILYFLLSFLGVAENVGKICAACLYVEG